MASKSFDKIIEEIGNMSVLELSDLVKALEEKFGVSAAMPVAAAAPAAQAEAAPAEEKSEYKVTLESVTKKMDAIKALREVTSLGLMEAKKTVEDAPTVIAEAVSKEDAEKMKAKLETAGAKVKLS